MSERVREDHDLPVLSSRQASSVKGADVGKARMTCERFPRIDIFFSIPYSDHAWYLVTVLRLGVKIECCRLFLTRQDLVFVFCGKIGGQSHQLLYYLRQCGSLDRDSSGG